MIPKELLDECDDIQRRVDAMTDEQIRSIGATRENLIRDRQHFAGVRYYSQRADPERAAGVALKPCEHDAGEAHRIKSYSDSKFVIEYPLVAWGWNRRRCVEVCAEEGFRPGKSSCFFCPNMKPGEILRLREAHPALVERAVAMERNNETTIVGLGRDWTWDALLSNDAAQQRIFADYSEEMPCGCYDGGDSESERAAKVRSGEIERGTKIAAQTPNAELSDSRPI